MGHLRPLIHHSHGIRRAQSTIGTGMSSTEMAKLALPSNSRPMETSKENSSVLTINKYLGHFMNSLNEFYLAEYVLEMSLSGSRYCNSYVPDRPKIEPM